VAIWALVVVGAVLVLALYWAVVRRPPVPLPVHLEAQNTPETCPDCTKVMVEIGQLFADMQTCRAAVAEGIEHVERVENRIRGTIKRARKELHEGGVESPGLAAEVAGLSLVDGERGDTEAMPVVPAGVVEPQSSVPGVTPEQLRRVRGI